MKYYHLISLLNYLKNSFFSYFFSKAFPIKCAKNIPAMQLQPHITDIYIVKTDNSIRKGPGQRDPIPHPSPKINAPKTNFQSILLFVGLNTV